MHLLGAMFAPRPAASRPGQDPFNRQLARELLALFAAKSAFLLGAAAGLFLAPK